METLISKNSLDRLLSLGPRLKRQGQKNFVQVNGNLPGAIKYMEKFFVRELKTDLAFHKIAGKRDRRIFKEKRAWIRRNRKLKALRKWSR